MNQNDFLKKMTRTFISVYMRCQKEEKVGKNDISRIKTNCSIFTIKMEYIVCKIKIKKDYIQIIYEDNKNNKEDYYYYIYKENDNHNEVINKFKKDMYKNIRQIYKKYNLCFNHKIYLYQKNIKRGKKYVRRNF